MEQVRFQQVMKVFEAVCQAAAEQRAGVLAAHCGTDADLRAAVEALLAEDAAGGLEAGAGADLLAREVAADAPPAGGVIPLAPPKGLLAGHYRIIGVLGEGGMGTVYEAEQARPRRRVALKALRPGQASSQAARRFEHEAHILGRLHHPGIAQIYEAGAPDAEHADQMYFVMELVRGAPLTTYARDRHLDIPHRLELIARVCDAVHHAHQRGVIHRDLKPTNILVVEDEPSTTAEDASAGGTRIFGRDFHAQPKVLDFGVARAQSSDDNVTTMHTLSGQIVGTLAYMSPEQVRGDPDDVDTRTDIYAIGVLLYELLGGRVPHDISRLTIPEAARVICDVEPPLLGTLSHACRGEIETIVARAMHKNPERRYGSAAALASDLRRYLAGEPIEAKRDSALYLLRKHLRRYRYAVATVALFMVMLAAFGVYAAEQATENLRLARGEQLARHQADATSQRLSQELRVNNIERGRLAGRSGDRRGAEDLLWREQLRTPEAIDSYWALWEYYFHNPCLLTRPLTVGTPRTAQYSPDGRYLALYGDGVIDVLHADGLAPAFEVRGGEAAWLPQLLSFNPDGKQFAFTAQGGCLGVFDVEEGRVVDTWKLDSPTARLVQWSPEGTRIGIVGEPKTVQLMDVTTGCWLPARARHPRAVLCMAFAPDGALLATADDAGEIRLWEGDALAPVATLAGFDDSASALAFSPDGRLLAAGSRDRTIRVWELEHGELRTTLRSPNGTIRKLKFCQDSQTLLSAGWWFVEAWNVQTGARSILAHHPSMTADICPDESEVVTAATEMRVWDAKPERAERHLSGHVGRPCAAFSSDGRWVATSDFAGTVRLWDADRGTLARTVAAHRGKARGLAFNSAGSLLATGADDGRVCVWRSPSLERVYTLDGHNNQSIQGVAFSPDGRWLAHTGADGLIHLVDAQTGAEQTTLRAGAGQLISLLFTPDSASLLVTTRGADLTRVALDGHVVAQTALPATGWTMTLSPDGEFVATGTWISTVEVLATNTLALHGTLIGHNAVVYAVAWDPQQQQILASGAADGTLRLWDVAQRRDVLNLTLFDRWDTLAVAFSPDGRRLLASGANGDVILLDLAYFNRHIAGNARYHLQRLASSTAFDEPAFETWLGALEAEGAQPTPRRADPAP